MSLRRFARIVVALLALVVLVVAAIEFAGISVDAQRWRAPIAEALSRLLGREVRLEGPARLVLSFRPALLVRDVRIANPPGFDTPEFGRIAELSLATELLPLLRGELIIHELRGREVTLRLARSSAGRGNWIFEPVRDTEDERPRRFRVDWRRVSVEQGLIEYADAAATRRFELEALTIDGLTGQRVRLALRGKLDQGRTYTAKATSAPLQELTGAQAWPFDVHVVLPASVISVSGTRRVASEGAALRLAFDARTADMRDLEQLLAVNLPSVSAARIAGELDLSPGIAALTSMKGMIGTTAIEGELAVDMTHPRPLLTGRLAIPELDLRAFRAAGTDAGEATTLAGAYRSFESAQLDLKWIALLDSELRIAIGRVAGAPGEARDFDASLRIESGRLTAPLAVTFAGARFDGEIAADGTTEPPRLRTQLVAREAPLGALAELLFDTPYVAGNVRRFEMMLDARGSNLGELARDLEGRISIADARFTYGNYAGGRPVAMHLDAAAVSQRRGQTLAGDLRGSLRGKAFDGRFRAGTVERILRERRTPFDFDGNSGSAVARLSGMLTDPTDRAGPEIAFEVTAPRARELTPWLGFSSESDARVALKGNVRVRQGHTSLTGASFLFGRTSLTGELAWQSTGGKALVKADLYAELLAPVELRSLASPVRRATLLEIPILPESLDFADSDLELRVKRVDGLPLEVADVALRGRMRGGEIKPSPFTLNVEGNALSGTLALDARGEPPTASLLVTGHDFDVGPVLRRLRVARDVDSRIGTVRLRADIRERRLGDVLEQSSFVASIESGTLDIRDSNTRAALRIAVKAGEVRADAGAPVTASLIGTAGAAPVTLEIRAARLRELFEPAERFPFSLIARTPAATLAISGSAAPQRSPDVALSLTFSGERLDGLDTLAETSLPPWGPYALTGQLRFSKRGYEFDGLKLLLGDNVFTGSGAVDTARVPPRLDAEFVAQRIQLNDFALGDWSPFEPRTAAGQPLTVESARQAVATGARRLHALFSQELVGRGEGAVVVAVKRVLSGRDDLGRGRFRAGVENGRAMIGPIEIEGEGGGSALGSFAYEPREHDVIVAARLRIDRFDYGRLARVIRPEARIDGALSLDLRLDATAPRLTDALAVGSGHFDFAVWPKRITGGLIDFWTVNMLFRLLPFVDASASFVNCAVGHFDLERGELRSRRLLIDTASSRAQGTSAASFVTNDVQIRIVPRPKVPQFFSLATPVEVTGTFDDYRIRVRPTDILGTMGQWVTSLVTVPFERVFGTRIPEDGHDECANPGR